MRVVILVLLAVIAITFALPKNEGNMDVKPSTIANSESDLESMVRILLERVRELIQNGKEDFSPLDPFFAELRQYDLSPYGTNGSYFELNRLSSTGMSSFETPDVSVTILSDSPYLVQVDLTVEIQQFEVYADSYDLNYGLELLGIQIYGQGEIGFTARQSRGVFTLIVAPDLACGIELSVIDISSSFSIGSFEPTLTGCMNNAMLSSQLENFFAIAVPELLVVLQELIVNILNPLIVRFVNNQLAGVDFTDMFA